VTPDDFKPFLFPTKEYSSRPLRCLPSNAFERLADVEFRQAPWSRPASTGQVLLIDEWRRTGVEIVFLNRSLGQSPEDDLLLQVQGIVSEYDNSNVFIPATITPGPASIVEDAPRATSQVRRPGPSRRPSQP
jgi:hypothetical protein